MELQVRNDPLSRFIALIMALLLVGIFYCIYRICCMYITDWKCKKTHVSACEDIERNYVERKYVNFELWDNYDEMARQELELALDRARVVGEKVGAREVGGTRKTSGSWSVKRRTGWRKSWCWCWSRFGNPRSGKRVVFAFEEEEKID